MVLDNQFLNYEKFRASTVSRTLFQKKTFCNFWVLCWICGISAVCCILMNFGYAVQQTCWLSSLMVECPTYDREVMGSISSWVAVNWLLFEWLTVCRQIWPSRYITNTKVNSAFLLFG